MENCLNLNIPQINKSYQELTRVFNNSKIAYALLTKNNGYSLEYTRYGSDSELYSQLLELPEVDGDVNKAIKLKAKVYSDSFINWYGNWLKDPNEFDSIIWEEPKLIDGKYFNGKEYKSPFNDTQTDINSLQGKALKFLKESGKGNISKIFDESSITINKDSRFKDKARVLDMLEKSSDDFKKNGLFLHKGDEYIMHLNADLFENLLDSKRLISKLNDRMRSRLKVEGLSEHNIISADKHNGEHWLVMTDENYGKTWDDAEAPERRNKILARNRYWINEANKVFQLTVGKPAIYLNDIQVGKYLTAIVSIDENVLKEYNSVKYTEYLNNMNEYMAKDDIVHEDFTIIPLKKKLQQELKYTRKAKSNAESKGVKQIDINKLDNKIEDLTERISKLQKSEDLTDIYNEAERDFINADRLIKADKMSTYQFNQTLNKLQLWVTSGDFSTSDHLFLDEEMMESEELQNKFSEIGKRAELLMAKLIDKGKPMLANIVNEEFGTELTYDKVVSLGHKLGWFPKLGYSLNRVGHALAQFVLKIVNEANDAAFRETKISSRNLADLYQKVKDTGFDLRNFYQQVALSIDGQLKYAPTGRLIHKFSDRYFKDRVKNKTVKFRKTNELVIDPRLLMGSTREEYIKEIESHLGRLEAAKYIKLAEDRYKNYQDIRKEHINLEYGLGEDQEQLAFEDKRNKLIQAINNGQEVWVRYKSKRQSDEGESATWRHITKGALNKDLTQLTDVEGSSDLKTFNIELDYRLLDVSLTEPTDTTSPLTEEQITELNDWDKQNSPIERIKALEKTKEKKLKDVFGKDTYLVIVPRKEVNGKSTGYIDENFSKIEASPSAYDFYQEAEKITNSAQVAYNSRELTSLSLAYVKMGMWDRLSKTGIANFLSKDLYNEIIESMSGGQLYKEEIDPITKKPVKKLKFDVRTIDQLIKDNYNSKLKAFKEANGDTVTKEQAEVMYYEASNEVIKGTNFDANNNSLFTSLNLLNLAALTYKHSSLIEDNVNIAMTYLPNSTVNTGNDIIDNKNNPVGQEYIDNLQNMVENTLDNMYYKTSKRDTSTVLRHLYTKEQRTKVRELRKSLLKPGITPEERNNIKQEIATIQQSTNKLTTNSLVKTLMAFLRIKGLGWNVPAGITNLLYGQLTNLYKAAEGRLFSIKDLGLAQKAIISDWDKFNKVIENYHIVGDVLYEFKQQNKFEEKKNWFFKVIKAVKPYSMQTATEKLNQGAVMIAMMLHQQVTNSKGETKPLWEAINPNGVLDEEWSIGDKHGDSAVTSIVSKIKSQIQEIHGDYSNPLMIKNTMAGQAIAMFRLWFFEMFHSRFGAEKMDYIRGLLTKGRYRTLLDLAKAYGFNPIKWRQAYKNNQLSEVDMVNMKVNLMEFTSIIFMLAGFALLKKGICGDDERCKDANLAQLFLLNEMKRLNQDVSLWVNPKGMADFVSNPTAMTSLGGDLAKLVQFSGNELFGDEESTIYQSGYNKDNKKLWILFKSQLPFVNSIERLKRYSDELLQTK